MKSTGIIRKIDDLGRFVIPRELRKNLNINAGDYLEIYTHNNLLCIKKHCPELHEEVAKKIKAAIEKLGIQCEVCSPEGQVVTSTKSVEVDFSMIDENRQLTFESGDAKLIVITKTAPNDFQRGKIDGIFMMAAATIDA